MSKYLKTLSIIYTVSTVFSMDSPVTHISANLKTQSRHLYLGSQGFFTVSL